MAQQKTVHFAARLVNGIGSQHCQTGTRAERPPISGSEE